MFGDGILGRLNVLKLLSTKMVAVVLFVFTVTWFIASVYGAWSQLQNDENKSGAYITAGKLPFEPSFHWSLTNSTPAASYILEAITHPHTPVHVKEQADQLNEMIDHEDGYVEYQGDYYGLGVFFVDDFNIPPSTLVWPPPPTLITGAVLGLLDFTWTG